MTIKEDLISVDSTDTQGHKKNSHSLCIMRIWHKGDSVFREPPHKS